MIRITKFMIIFFCYDDHPRHFYMGVPPKGGVKIYFIPHPIPPPPPPFDKYKAA